MWTAPAEGTGPVQIGYVGGRGGGGEKGEGEEVREGGKGSERGGEGRGREGGGEGREKGEREGGGEEWGAGRDRRKEVVLYCVYLLFRFAVVMTQTVYWANQRTAAIAERGQ